MSARSIKDAMSDSPRGISPTDKRVEYLLKAKHKRNQRNEDRRSNFFLSMGEADMSVAGATIMPSLTARNSA